MSEHVTIYKLGITGKAYDVPGTRRAYTYQHQPDNQGAWKLGRACCAAYMEGGGDCIDFGLGLLKQLEANGFGVYELGEAKAAELQHCKTCDGTGDVHRADGEYLGECHCVKAHRAALEAGDLMAIAEECGAGRMTEHVAQVTRGDLERIIQFVKATQPSQVTVEFSQFLTSVMDAAGLIRHGRTSKELSEYLGKKCVEFRTGAIAAAQPSQVNRIPAGLYAELEALRTLRDATRIYRDSYMRDEIEDEDSCVSVDQHDAACSVQAALESAQALEWKGGEQ